MLSEKFLLTCLLAVQVYSFSSSTEIADHDDSSNSKVNQSDFLEVNPSTQSDKRTARIMKILKDPKMNPARNIWDAQAPQKTRRDRLPPAVLQRPMPMIFQRNPAQPVVHYPGMRNHPVHRRVHNGPPSKALLRPQYQQQQQLTQQQQQQGKPARFPLNVKEHKPAINAGKAAVYRPQFAAGTHPNALQQHNIPAQKSQQQQQQFHNFKPSQQFSGDAIVRPASDYPQYAKLLKEYMLYPDIEQYPLPQQQQQQTKQQQFSEFFKQNPSANTAPQTFAAAPQQQNGKIYKEQLLQSAGNGDSQQQQQMYSVYEDPELSERVPQHYNYEASSPMAAKEAEEYLKFMSTNEYFLPKLRPNYPKLDEVKDIQNYKPPQRQRQSFPAIDTSGAATFEHPLEVSQLYYQLDATRIPDSTVVRGSYQAGNNAFVVKSDGNKAVKHVMPSSVVAHRTTTPSNVASSYAHFQFNPMRQRTPEPIHFEFTERDAVIGGAHTNAPPANNVHLRYKAVNAASDGRTDLLSASIPSSNSVYQNRPISVNEVDDDPEDGDDMQDAGTGFYGRVPIRSSTTESILGSSNKGSTTTTPATEQKDTEEYCERICANVQDDDEEIVCGSDGYMYTGEAQMECYASCLNIDVTIQGKGSCSAR